LLAVLGAEVDPAAPPIVPPVTPLKKGEFSITSGEVAANF
jgi:hypothetical protein